MVNLFSFGCHVIDRAYASTDCTGGVGETIKRKGGVSQACLVLFGETSSTKAKGGNRDVTQRYDTHKGDIRKIRHSGPG